MWWQTEVIYQIYPRSFLDDDGDGIGDLAGIRRRLDHLAWLGVDALWLSPIYVSPMADFGYDVSDHTAIDPVFGDLETFDALVAEAHARQLRVILDFVPNHTSDQHRWFVESRVSRTSPKRDWYVWRDGRGTSTADRRGGPPNNWIRAWHQLPAWTYDEATEQWYLHLFLPEQPDLNWADPEVEAAMHDVMRFWLDRGVDGFRMDVVHCIGKDPALADDPPDMAAMSHVPLNDRPETHALLRGIRSVLDEYPGDRMAVGEVYLLDTARVVTYVGPDQLNLAFNFRPLFMDWDAAKWRAQIEIAERAHNAVGAWPTWVLSNHDVVRQASRYGSEARARAAAVLLLTLRGTPFLYAGEELGLRDAVIPPDRVVDPGGRDGCRAPIPWDGSADHGWPAAPGATAAEPWLPWPPDSAHDNVQDERSDPTSVLHLYRRVLAARRGSPASTTGALELVEGLPAGVLGYRRAGEADERTVLVNFSSEAVPVPAVAGRVEVASDGRGEGNGFTATLGPDQAVIVRP